MKIKRRLTRQRPIAPSVFFTRVGGRSRPYLAPFRRRRIVSPGVHCIEACNRSLLFDRETRIHACGSSDQKSTDPIRMLNTIETPARQSALRRNGASIRTRSPLHAREKTEVAIALAAFNRLGLSSSSSCYPRLSAAEIQIEGAKIEEARLLWSVPPSPAQQDGINYSLLAEKALQDIKNPNMITLKTSRHPCGQCGVDRTCDGSKRRIRPPGQYADADRAFHIVMDNGLRAESRPRSGCQERRPVEPGSGFHLSSGMSVVARRSDDG